MANHPQPALTSRPYDNERDFQAMQDLLAAARSRTGDRLYPHLGDFYWNFFVLSCHEPLPDHIRLWHNATGRLVAYVILGGDPPFDVQVLPEYAWSGIEAEALAWAEARLAELRARDARRWGDPLSIVVRQGDAQRIAFLEQHGFRRGQHVELSLLRSLAEPIPAPEPPPDYVIRPVAGPEEAAERADVEHEVWAPSLVSQLTGDDYARLMQLPGYDRELDIVASTPEGAIVSYVNNWLDPLNRVGVCGPVGTRAAHRRRGLARAALLESLRRQQERGMDRVVISTGETNIPARRTYESLGFVPTSAFLTYAKAE
jgi:mycothiol synthase